MTVIDLPPTMDRTTTGTLISTIDAALADTEGVVIEGRNVGRIGQCGLQLMLSTMMTAQARGATLTMLPSPAMLRAAEIAGLDEDLGWNGGRP